MKRLEFLKLLSLMPLALHAMKTNQLNQMVSDFSQSPTMPLLFVGHGNPMNAIEENQFVNEWRRIAANIPQPNAILCVSAHWETKGSYVTAMPKPRTIHDFGGFPDELFQVQYSAPGDIEMAKTIIETVPDSLIKPDVSWGLDHGCWSVLKQMYPAADIPVLQLSIDYTKPLEYHTQLAAQLGELRKKGVLIMGSGNMVHNLGMIDWRNPDKGFDWAIEANEGFKKAILEEDFVTLHAIQTKNRAFALSVPTLEHFIPLLYSMGLKQKKESIHFFNDTMVMGSLSMTSLIINS